MACDVCGRPNCTTCRFEDELERLHGVPEDHIDDEEGGADA